jgi:signal transduction histidine kinase
VQALLGGPDSPEWDVAIPDDVLLDESTERHVYLLVKELVSNVARHAHARHASIRLERNALGHMVVEVTDDGVGYDPARVSDSSYGLRSIDHRVAMLRASLTTTTAPGLGTRVVVTIPADDVPVIPPVNATSA